MWQTIRFDPNNASIGISREKKPSSRQILLGGKDLNTKQCRKTKKSAAELLHLDNEKHFLSPPQREAMMIRAGKAYHEDGEKKLRKSNNPYARMENETESAHIIRINSMLEGK